MTVTDLLLVVVAYLLGSLPSGYIFSQALKGADIRSKGSGNVGGMNVFRNVGLAAGALTGVTDVLKASLAVYLALRFGQWSWVPLASAVTAVLGHNYMLFLGFRGGKGLACIIGSFAILYPPGLISFLLLIAILSLALGDTNFGTGIAAWAWPFLLWWQAGGWVAVVLGAILAVVVFAKHLPDMKAYARGRRQLL